MFGTILKKLREDAGMSQEQLGGILGISKSTIGMYEQGNREPKNAVLVRLAEIFKVTVDALLGCEKENETYTALYDESDLEKLGITRPQYEQFPVLGKISCGLPILCVEENDIFVDASSDIRADFCLTARGNSMINARIFDGDTIFIRHQHTVSNGEIAAVIVNDEEVTLKRLYYYPEQGRLILQPENPTYQPQEYSGEELNHIRVIGKAIAATHHL